MTTKPLHAPATGSIGCDQTTRAEKNAMTTATKPASSDRELSRLTLARLGRNEALARGSSNETTFPHADERVPFQCECEGERCHETLLLTRADYDHVRAQAGQLIVASGHQIAETQIQQRLHGCFVVQRATTRGS